jgi:hypothetical protein
MGSDLESYMDFISPFIKQEDAPDETFNFESQNLFPDLLNSQFYAMPPDSNYPGQHHFGSEIDQLLWHVSSAPTAPCSVSGHHHYHQHHDHTNHHFGMISPQTSFSRIGSQVSELGNESVATDESFQFLHTPQLLPATSTASLDKEVPAKASRKSASSKSQNDKKSTSSKTSKGIFPCPFPGCGRQFTRKDNIKYHMRTHQADRPRPYACKQCDRSYYRAIDLSRHVAVTHDKIRPFQCVTCGQQYTRKEALKRHYEKVHASKLADATPSQ